MFLFHLLGPLFIIAGAIGVGALVIGSLLHRVETKAELLRPGMHGVIGRFGGGKSYFLATVAARARAAGRPVYANIHIQGCEYWSRLDELPGLPAGAVVIVDEAHLVFPVRIRSLPPDIEGWLSQLRHHDQLLMWATQHWSMVNARLRKLSFSVWVSDPELGGHVYAQYTGQTFPADGRVKVGNRQAARLARMRVRRSKEVQASYDTHEDVVPDAWWEREKLAKTKARIYLLDGLGAGVAGLPAGVPSARDGEAGEAGIS